MTSWFVYAIGFCAQILFSSRLIVQWLSSEKEKKVMKENRLSNNNYGVFCIAAQLEQNNRELDVLWDKALKLYDEFRNSKFNNLEESELECINEFLNKK